jgi:hypothetical protein
MIIREVIRVIIECVQTSICLLPETNTMKQPYKGSAVLQFTDDFDIPIKLVPKRQGEEKGETERG